MDISKPLIGVEAVPVKPPARPPGLDWNGPNDPDNPQNWPLRKKVVHIVVPSLFCLTVTIASSLYVAGIPGIVDDFGVSRTAALLGLSLYTVGLAFGPILAAPVSETRGRRAVYWFTLVLFSLFILTAGLSKTFAGLVVSRFFAGFFGGSVLSIAGGTNADIWTPLSRAPSTALMALCTSIGPGIGPIIGGFIAEQKPWQWTQWVVLVFAAATLVGLFTQKETYKKTILLKRLANHKREMAAAAKAAAAKAEEELARKLEDDSSSSTLWLTPPGTPPPQLPLPIMIPRKPVSPRYQQLLEEKQRQELHQKLEQEQKKQEQKPPAQLPPRPPTKLAMLRILFTITLTRPLRMLATEPIVFFFSLYGAFTVAILFAFLEAYPLIFSGVYGFRPHQVGLVFLSICFGCLLGAVLHILIDRYVYRPRALALIARSRYYKRTGGLGGQGQAVVALCLPPEHRLYGAMVGGIGIPIGLFMFGWVVEARRSWVGALIAGIPFGFGIILIFLSSAMYMVDTYAEGTAASAMAANGFIRYVISALLPLGTFQMFETLGAGWASSVFGIVSVVMLPLPWILFVYGPRIRKKSHFETRVFDESSVPKVRPWPRSRAVDVDDPRGPPGAGL